MGDLDSLAALRRTVRNSFPVAIYKPNDGEAWSSAYERFRKICH